MMKKDGKEIYTFVGLINRMDACKDRSYCFTEKDIPETVEFRDKVYKLNQDEKFYYDPGTGVPLAEIVGKAYGMDMYKYLTEHEFIVTPKEKIFLTSEEKEFLRMCNVILKGGVGIESVYISTDTFDKIICIRFKDDTGLYVPIGQEAFKGVPLEKDYPLAQLGIYD